MSFSDEIQKIARSVLEVARSKGVKLAVAESCTGGLVSAALTDIPGSSAVVERGFITYSNEAKMEMLGVPGKLIQDHGAVSEQVAEAMADGALAKSYADVAVSITGVAGPGATGAKPEGRVCFALAKDGQGTAAVTVEFGALGRTSVREASVLYALNMVLDALETG